MINTITLLGVNVSRVEPGLALQQICEWVTQKQCTYVCVAPVATLVDARRNPAYAHAVNGAGMVTPDGMPVVWLAQCHGCKDIASFQQRRCWQTNAVVLYTYIIITFQTKNLTHMLHLSHALRRIQQ